MYCNQKGIECLITVNGKKGNMSIVREVLVTGNAQKVSDFSITAPWDGKTDYDYMLWVDSDVFFVPSDFESLLAHDKDIVSGVYAMMHGYNENLELLISMSAADLTNNLYGAEAHGLQPALWFGFGFCLIKRGVFERIPRPWFPTQKMEMASRDGFSGEDVCFCLGARKAGFELWADCSLRLPHKKEIFVFLPPEPAI
jgi:hypothetical protein